MPHEHIDIDLEYNGPDDGGVLVSELEDFVAEAINKFRENHLDVAIFVEMNGVA